MHHIDFIITKSSLDNGRIYFETSHTSFFPSDVIGGRGSNEYAPAQISIDAAGKKINTDIRISSSVRISPRKSFRSWMRSEQVVAGGKARLHSIDKRNYIPEFLS